MRRSARPRRLTALLAVVCVAGLAAPAVASAHATLEGSSPARDATLARAPSQVVFRFDETVEGNFGAVRVYDAAGRRVDEGNAFHPGGAGARLAVRLKRGLAAGTYTATYRVVSSDSHVVASGLIFSIGHASATRTTVAGLLRTARTGVVTSTAFAAARALQYGAIGVAGGVLALLLVVWPGALRAASRGVLTDAGERWREAAGAFGRRVRALLLAASLVGALSALAAVVLEGAEATGVSGWAALRPQIVRDLLGTRFGASWSIAAACWVAVAALTPVCLRDRERPGRERSAAASGQRTTVWPLALPIGYLLLVPALSGHASTQSPSGVLLPANVLHVTAMAAWLGGLLTLLVALPAATRWLQPGERTQLLSAVLARFSTLALSAVGLLLLSGLVQAYIEIRHLGLIFTTAFGRAAFIKLVLLLALIALGTLNRRRTLPRLHAAAHAQRSPGADGVVLRRTLRAEIALIAVVLGVTGALAGYVPATSVGSGPFSVTTRIGRQQLQLTLDPTRVGANELHLYLTDPRTGAQLDDAKQVDVSAALPERQIGAIRQQASKAGPGHYVVPRLVLGVRGSWRLTLTVRVNDFDEYTKRFDVELR